MFAGSARLRCRVKGQYLPTFQVSKYCLLTLHGRVHTSQSKLPASSIIQNTLWQFWVNVGSASQPMCKCDYNVDSLCCVCWEKCARLRAEGGGGGRKMYRPMSFCKSAFLFSKNIYCMLHGTHHNVNIIIISF